MITLKNIVLRRSAKVLLDSATVTINPSEKVGLVGRNGAGKSTLFGLLNGSLQEDAGECHIPRNGVWVKWHRTCLKRTKARPNL
jgi:ATP-binding cassette, subfamily F, member 3